MDHQQIIWATRRGNERAFFEALSYSTNSPTSLHLPTLHTPHGNNILHLICEGDPVGPLSGFLLGWPEGVRPSPHDANRATLLTALLSPTHPFASTFLPLVYERNNDGMTPAHLAINSASPLTLTALVTTATATATATLSSTLDPPPHLASLLFSVSDHKGRTALDIAIASQQWECAALLASTAPFSHDGASVSTRIQSILRNPTPPPRGYGVGPSHIVGGVINRLWDSFASRKDEVAVVAAYAGTSSATGGGDTEIIVQSRRIQRVPVEVPVPVPVPGHERGLVKRMEDQIERVASTLQVSLAEAHHLLLASQWNEDVAGDTLAHLLSSSSSSPSLVMDVAATGSRSSHAREKKKKQCMVCFEEYNIKNEDSVANKALRTMPCVDRHFTCDACWRGILRATPYAPRCPSLDCRLPLPLSTARALLLDKKECDRFVRLTVQTYVAQNPGLRWCPGPGCHQCFQLQWRGGDSSSSQQQQRQGGGIGVDAHCATCHHHFCFTCGAPPHEPASCSHYRSWTEELDSLRANAVIHDRSWLSRHAKECPGCGVYTQRVGGCNHMQCIRCQRHWCWECGRDWKEHGTATGGFYFCVFAESEAEAGGGSRTYFSTTASWLRQAWDSVKNVASQATLQKALQLHLRHQVDAESLHRIARHLNELIRRMHGGTDSGSGSGIRITTPEDVGVKSKEALRLDMAKWGALVTAACLAWMKKQKKQQRVITAAPVMSTNGNGNETKKNVATTAPTTAPPLPPLPHLNVGVMAEAVVDAHTLLQRAAATLRSLPAGPRRKYHQELLDNAELCLSRVEPLLMDVPYQEEAAAAAAGGGNSFFFLAPVGNALRSTLGGVVSAWRGVHGPRREFVEQGGVVHRLPAFVVVAQAHHAAALQRSSKHILERVDALREALNELRNAGRAGLFC